MRYLFYRKYISINIWISCGSVHTDGKLRDYTTIRKDYRIDKCNHARVCRDIPRIGITDEVSLSPVISSEKYVHVQVASLLSRCDGL